MYFANIITVAAVANLIPTVLGSYFVPVQTSALTECGTVELAWQGQAPFTVTVWPSCEDDAETTSPLATHKTNSTSSKWIVNLTSGKGVMFGVEDANGNEDYTDDYKVSAGNAKCVGAKASFTDPAPKVTAVNSTLPTTQASAPSSTAAVGNVGGLLPSTTDSDSSSEPTAIGGLGNGALTSFNPRVEVASAVVFGVVLSAVFF